MKICLDSNVYIDLLRGRTAVADFLAECEEIVVPAAVVAELTAGFHQTRDARAQDRALGRFLDRDNVVFRPADYAVATRYGHLAHLLRRKGRPIPANDIWIAATALETGTYLASCDRHFDEIEGLPRIER